MGFYVDQISMQNIFWYGIMYGRNGQVGVSDGSKTKHIG